MSCYSFDVALVIHSEACSCCNMEHTLVVGCKAQVVEVQRHEGQRGANERRCYAHQQQYVQPRVAPDRKAS
jgi:hypothetical protein